MDLPLGDLLLGLSCAALIGAAGGIVYGGILGPADKSSRRRQRTASKWIPWRIPERRARFLRGRPTAESQAAPKGGLRFWAGRRAKTQEPSRASDDTPAEGDAASATDSEPLEPKS
jgi:hypothetical protein